MQILPEALGISASGAPVIHDAGMRLAVREIVDPHLEQRKLWFTTNDACNNVGDCNNKNNDGACSNNSDCVGGTNSASCTNWDRCVSDGPIGP
jgi:hypothetical protein